MTFSIKRIMVTGANGFVGQAICAEALARGFNVTGATRTSFSFIPHLKNYVVSDINSSTDWALALEGCDVVVHLAARVHVMREHSGNPLAEFRRLNVEGTEHLARSAAKAGVKRLVYVSSIKVNGEETSGNHIYCEQDVPAPQDPYGISKWEAEQVLHQIAQETGLEVGVVRPPLVYGAGVKGNFAQMLSVLARGLPLPFATITNRRSLIYVENLVDVLILCATHPAAAGQTYLVSDGEDVSTPDLLNKLSLAMGKSPRLFPFPIALLKLAGRLVGKSDQISRVVGSLRVDSSKIRRELGWVPPFSVDDGLKATVKKKLYD
ncbi:SDR family oxidoreductase [Methylotenera sp.]|uniref:UDP-glucose 4-epimerase family protein n=1 Tax=Methylotenera sp. TaxID=2051956 RepID=UPI002487BF75|nr:SDR family oxidoreductase [Methylotenera sp.]MDI1299679.1 SDR family oxidoreductase [Methylotenera sp.]